MRRWYYFKDVCTVQGVKILNSSWPICTCTCTHHVHAWSDLRETCTCGILRAHVDSIDTRGSPVADPVGNTCQIAGTSCEPVVTELTTDGKIGQGIREFDLPVSNMRRAPAKLEHVTSIFSMCKQWYYCSTSPLTRSGYELHTAAHTCTLASGSTSVQVRNSKSLKNTWATQHMLCACACSMHVHVQACLFVGHVL